MHPLARSTPAKVVCLWRAFAANRSGLPATRKYEIKGVEEPERLERASQDFSTCTIQYNIRAVYGDVRIHTRLLTVTGGCLLQCMSPILALRVTSRRRNDLVALRCITDIAGPADGFASVACDPSPTGVCVAAPASLLTSL